ncbi:glucose-6-phosphate 1-dehydrogenase [Gregarina niphandrodes]|uniref:Glucose-6-phosphate 1-dehydrogenase n=1 Tax=Gregarina niphandrodes TaxID=110365 RepID=A0A023AXZ1_GRENI|nr:glucose-6-phosphate 1-dehydrogenase [Gregarina niphandrodes]EZG43526.1 glucose-6-phosphate 1-dehydrogenase [Gregarina niphandrodes]|eukprot:XP_011133244.1 glucose-6-phosphate 1-dehydrogenase [Gregarina niphandrodes]
MEHSAYEVIDEPVYLNVYEDDDFEDRAAMSLLKTIKQVICVSETDTLWTGKYAIIGLSGGVTQEKVYDRCYDMMIRDATVDWTRLVLFLVDEKYPSTDSLCMDPVATPQPTSAPLRVEPKEFDLPKQPEKRQTQGKESNVRLILRTLLKPGSPIPLANFIHPDTSLTLADCIEAYDRRLHGIFQFSRPTAVVLELGMDGNVGAWFPPLTTEMRQKAYDPSLYATSTRTSSSNSRITIPLHLIVSARTKLFFLHGTPEVNAYKRVVMQKTCKEVAPASPTGAIVDANTLEEGVKEQPLVQMVRSGSCVCICYPPIDRDQVVCLREEWAGVDGVLNIVILGASGDLAQKKTFPALYSLHLSGHLPPNTRIHAYARSRMDEGKLWSKIGQKILLLNKDILGNEAEDRHVKEFMERIEYHQCQSYDDPESAAKLNLRLKEIESPFTTKRLILYLALPPNQFIPAVEAFRENCWRSELCMSRDTTLDSELTAEGLGAEDRGAEDRGAEDRGAEDRGAEDRGAEDRGAEGRGAEGRGAEGRGDSPISANSQPRSSGHGGSPAPAKSPTVTRPSARADWTRVVVEKPFGHDYDSALEMSSNLQKYTREEEVYRIDHYLGKEMVLNLFVLRFANSFIAPLWNRHHINCVRITFKEKIGTMGRGGYFDSFGVIRDVVQNHLIQILSLVAMETPVTLRDEHVRDEKVKLLRAVPPTKLEDTVLGQYTAGDDMPGYLDDPTVPPDSLCPTFVTTVLWVNNERWSGVPFILKAGKALEKQTAEIRVQFHPPRNHLFENTPCNELVLRIQPDDAIYMKCLSKRPGLGTQDDLVETELDLSILDRLHVNRINDAYERLLLDVINGDKKNFVRTDELLEAWRIFDPLLNKIQTEKIKPEYYKAGSQGPMSHYELIKRLGYQRYEGYVWHKS